MDKPSLVDLAHGSGDADRELEESSCLHRLAEMLLQRLAPWILEKQHHPITPTNQLQWPNSPRAIQIILESVLIEEPFGACRQRGLCSQPQREHIARRSRLVSRSTAAER